MRVGSTKLAKSSGKSRLKWHLAGVVRVDHRTFGQDFRDAYAQKTLGELTTTRVRNLGLILQPQLPTIKQTWTGSMSRRDFRRMAFLRLPLGMGVFCLALYAAPLFLLRSLSRPLALAVLVSLGVWVLAMFQPRATVPHQGSYFPQLALIALGIAVLARGKRTRGIAGAAILIQALIAAVTFAL